MPLAVFGPFVKIVPSVIPRQHNPAGDHCALCLYRFDVKLEALAAFEALRQCGNDTGQLDVLGFPWFGQLIGQPELRHHAGPDKPRQHIAGERCGAKGPMPSPGKQENPGQRQHSQQANDAFLWQNGLQLEYGDTAGKSDDDRLHGLNDPE